MAGKAELAGAALLGLSAALALQQSDQIHAATGIGTQANVPTSEYIPMDKLMQNPNAYTGHKIVTYAYAAQEYLAYTLGRNEVDTWYKVSPRPIQYPVQAITEINRRAYLNPTTFEFIDRENIPQDKNPKTFSRNSYTGLVRITGIPEVMTWDLNGKPTAVDQTRFEFKQDEIKVIRPSEAPTPSQYVAIG